MKLVLTSDTHLGITKPSALDRMFAKIAEEKPHLLIHAGDYSGMHRGDKAVEATLKIVRKHYQGPLISVLGNHDFWCRPYEEVRPALHDFQLNYSNILHHFKDFKVHFLDEDGPFFHEDLILVGHSGWYANMSPPTNDRSFLPIGIEGNTNNYLFKRAEEMLLKQLNSLAQDQVKGKKILFTSHFPVINKGDDWKGSFADFGGNPHWPLAVQSLFDCNYFLNGHAHQLHEGPLRYEAGSDYEDPRYLILEV